LKKSKERTRLNVWVGLCGNGRIIEPYFFNRNVNGRTYEEMLQNVAFPVVAHNYQSYAPVFHVLCWFQDGAPAHYSVAIRRMLQARFENRVVALPEAANGSVLQIICSAAIRKLKLGIMPGS